MRTRKYIYACLFSVAVFAAAAEGVTGINAGNCYEYLKLGQVNYSIKVNMDGIRLKEDVPPEEFQKRTEELTTLINEKPVDLDLRITLYDYYSENDRDREAKELMSESMKYFKKDYTEKKNEDSIYWYAKALINDMDDKNNEEAYRLLQPYLESGRASPRMYELAISMRVAVLDFNLATRIADAYIAVYPDDPEPYYQRFINVFAKSMYGIVSYMMNAAASDYYAKKGISKLSRENLGEFMEYYFIRLNQNLSVPDIEKAVKLAPESYRYNLAAGVFKTMVLFYTSMMTKAQTVDIDDENILEVFKVVDEAGLNDARTYLLKALELKPEEDIQVFLGLAMYYLVSADFKTAESFARKAIALRPKAREAYDALITTVAMPVLSSGTEKLDDLLSVLSDILAEKLAKAGGAPDDYSSLAGFCLKEIKHADEKKREELLRKMKEYTDKALKLDPDHSLSLITLSSCYLLGNDPGKALEILEELEKTVPDEFKDMLYNNRGVIKAVMGRKKEGIADLQKALEYSSDDSTTIKALKILGVNEN
ncbi:MAG: hypothetical protein JW969_12010 [Spirochaetales bacterium]|nr:hypothetical protein [Spirochaetales bacterium]